MYLIYKTAARNKEMESFHVKSNFELSRTKVKDCWKCPKCDMIFVNTITQESIKEAAELDTMMVANWPLRKQPREDSQLSSFSFMCANCNHLVDMRHIAAGIYSPSIEEVKTTHPLFPAVVLRIKEKKVDEKLEKLKNEFDVEIVSGLKLLLYKIQPVSISGVIKETSFISPQEIKSSDTVKKRSISTKYIEVSTSRSTLLLSLENKYLFNKNDPRHRFINYLEMKFPRKCCVCGVTDIRFDFAEAYHVTRSLGKTALHVGTQKMAASIWRGLQGDRIWFAVPFCRDHGFNSGAFGIKQEAKKRLTFRFANTEYGREVAALNNLDAYYWDEKKLLKRNSYFALAALAFGAGALSLKLPTSEPTRIIVFLSALLAVVLFVWFGKKFLPDRVVKKMGRFDEKTSNPFIFRNGMKANTILELVQFCEQFPADGIYHLTEGHFEPWLRDTGINAAVESAVKARTAEGSNDKRLKMYLKEMKAIYHWHTD